MNYTNNCVMCGAEINKPGRKYCCTECKRKAASEKRAEYIQTRGRGNMTIKHLVVPRYAGMCAICGWQMLTPGIKLNGKTNYQGGCDMHHIIPVSQGGEDTEENVILLCPNHHKLADEGIITRETLRQYLNLENNFDKGIYRVMTPTTTKRYGAMTEKKYGKDLGDRIVMFANDLLLKDYPPSKIRNFREKYLSEKRDSMFAH